VVVVRQGGAEHDHHARDLQFDDDDEPVAEAGIGLAHTDDR
jgi:hypothetical protein